MYEFAVMWGGGCDVSSLWAAGNMGVEELQWYHEQFCKAYRGAHLLFSVPKIAHFYSFNIYSYIITQIRAFLFFFFFFTSQTNYVLWYKNWIFWAAILWYYKIEFVRTFRLAFYRQHERKTIMILVPLSAKGDARPRHKVPTAILGFFFFLKKKKKKKNLPFEGTGVCCGAYTLRDTRPSSPIRLKKEKNEKRLISKQLLWQL